MDWLRDLGVEVWAWFGVEANRDTLGAVISALGFLGGVAAAILGAAVWVFRQLRGKPESESLESPGQTGNQSGSGNQFLAETIGNVTITGISPNDGAPTEPILKMTLDQFEERQRSVKNKIRTELEASHGKDRARLEGELAEVQRRLADLPAAFEEAQKRIEELEQLLEREGNEIGAERLRQAQEALEKGDYSIADEIFAEIEARDQLAVERSARASFGRGEIAKAEVRWADAARNFARAADLRPTFEHLFSARELAWRSGNYGAALHYGEILVEIATTEESVSATQRAAAINEHALTLEATGRYAAAEPLHRQALEIRRNSLGEAHPEYAESLNNLACLLETKGDYSEAESLYRRALLIDQKTLGDEHPDYAVHLNNLACLLRVTGRAEEAELLFRQALEIDRKMLGKSHPDYAVHLNNLADLLRTTGRYDEAEPLCSQALEIGASTLGEAHPAYAAALSNLAGLRRATGRAEEAELLYRRAMEITGKTLGQAHPKYAFHLNDFAGLLRAMGRTENVESLYLQALEILKSSLGSQHPNTVMVQENYENYLASLSG